MTDESPDDGDKKPDTADKPTRDARGRWLPGHCPNPEGRPKKKQGRKFSETDLMIFGYTLIDISTNGEPEQMVRREALLNKMFESAMKGNVGMQKFLYQEFEKLDERMANIRLHYDKLVAEWITENPDFSKPDFEVPPRVWREIDDLRALLFHYFPSGYRTTMFSPHQQNPPDDAQTKSAAADQSSTSANDKSAEQGEPRNGTDDQLDNDDDGKV